MRLWLLMAAVLALAGPARAEETYGSLDFSRLSEKQADFFWRRLKSLAIEEAVLAHCGQSDDFAERAKQGVRACVTPEALAKAETFFRAEMKTAQASLRARKASCGGKPAPTRGWLGVELSDAEGAMVTGTVAGSPAASADIKAGDVITAVNGAAVSGPKDLSAKIRALSPGADAKIALKRDGATHEISVNLGAQAYDADGRIALDLPALVASSKEDLRSVADEVTAMCGKCKSTVWALFCR